MKYRALGSNYLSLIFILMIGWLSGMASVYACDPNIICTTLYDPVCGTDGRTYSNSCMAERACVDVAYPGVCTTEPPVCQDLDNDNYSPDGGECGPIDCNDLDPNINPDMACLHVYDPVCGVDGNTYPNACEALRACVPVAYPGECAADIPLVAYAFYNTSRRALTVIARSELGKDDELTVEGFGAMRWSNKHDRWILIIRNLASDQVPATITVNGLQASTTVEVMVY